MGSVEPLLDVLADAHKWGFVGPGPVADHITHARGFASACGSIPESFLDLGSGGGVPGLVLAAVWSDARGVLLDSSTRRTTFLARAVERLGFDGRVRVVRDRAEMAGRDAELRGSFACVVARGFGPPAVTAECGAPFLALGGKLVVSEPPTATDRWSVEGLALLGLDMIGTAPDTRRFQVMQLTRPCPDQYPRRTGMPGKRPLWSVSRETS